MPLTNGWIDGDGGNGEKLMIKQQKMSKEEAIAYRISCEQVKLETKRLFKMYAQTRRKIYVCKPTAPLQKMGSLCGKCSTQNVYVADIGGKKLRVRCMLWHEELG